MDTSKSTYLKNLTYQACIAYNASFLCIDPITHDIYIQLLCDEEAIQDFKLLCDVGGIRLTSQMKGSAEKALQEEYYNVFKIIKNF